MATVIKKKIRPPLKWAGGKYRLLDKLLPKIGSGGKLIEPFLGSGSVFLNVDFDEYHLSDINEDLINFYKHIKSDGSEFIDYSAEFFKSGKYNNEKKYYELRHLFNETDDLHLKSALFLYINKHGYNGLCRYNASGRLNVPFGRYKKPYFPRRELEVFYKKSQKAEFECCSFDLAMSKALKGDVVYCDPPYVPLSTTANFTSYSAGGFGAEGQKLLASLAESLSQSGVRVVVSNHYTPYTLKLYKAARKYKHEVRRTISCDGSKRDMAYEVIAVFSGK